MTNNTKYIEAYVVAKNIAVPSVRDTKAVNAVVEAVLSDLEAHIRAGIRSGDHWSRRALDKIKEMRG